MKRIIMFAVCAAGLMGVAYGSAFQNGSFEFGTNPGNFTTLFGGNNTSITGWTVGGASIDYIGSYWQASNGSRSLDLGGNNNGGISQTFDTIIGQTYSISFDLSGNPDQHPANNIYVVNVSAANLNANFTYNWQGQSHSNMMWQTFTATFTATSTSTTLTFVDVLPPGPYGPALDNVRMAAVPEPFTIGLMGCSALAALVRMRRRATSARA